MVDATSTQWPETELVVKVSWPGSGRVLETEFLKKASEEAERTKDGWAINHLPRILHASDGVFGEDSILKPVGLLFQIGMIVGRPFQYERRTLRVIIQERLYSLKSLTSVKSLG